MKINQILWVINNETRAVVPVKIVEKITKETVSGQKIEFIVELINGKKRNLSELGATFFESPEEAREYLLHAATNLVDEIVSRAIEVAQKFLSPDSDVQESLASDMIQGEPEPEMITLPDGTKARLRIKPGAVDASSSH